MTEYENVNNNFNVAIEKSKIEKKSNNDLIDVVKIVLSIMVVAIHANIIPNILYPWLRLAVPLFFIIQSYFFFNKINGQDSENRNKILKNFVKRNLTLYLFYFILTLPITIYIRRDLWINNGILLGILYFCRSVLFGSTFVASWYIMASVLGTIIIFFLSKYFSNITLMIFTSLIFILIALDSSYKFILLQYDWIFNLNKVFTTIFNSPYNNFMISLYWIVCGKMFVERKKTFNIYFNLITIIISSILLYIEWYFVREYSNLMQNDIYILLGILCPSIFDLILRFNCQYKNAVVMRKLSIIIYALHGSMLSLIQFFTSKILNDKLYFIDFFIVLIICVAIGFVIIILQNKKPINRILKYAT